MHTVVFTIYGGAYVRQRCLCDEQIRNVLLEIIK
jgi:hypothetical protein